MSSEYVVGARVSHSKHGVGTVFMVREGRVVVDFDSGVRESFDQWGESKRDVERAAHDLRVRREAKRIVDAEEAPEPGDHAAEFLTRSGLETLPALAYLINGILPRDSYGILRGRDGTFKSFVAVDWALCVATGKPWQGRRVERRARVLYIAGEGAHGLAARVAAWEGAWRTKVDDDWFIVRKSALNMHTPGPAFEHLLEYVTAQDVGLVVVDTLRRVSGGADENSSEMGTVVDNLDRLKRAAGSVLAIAHTGKGDNDTRGYSGIEDDADFVWHSKRDGEQIELANTKMKDDADGTTLHLVTRPAGGSLVLAEASAAASTVTVQSQRTLLRTLQETFPDGARRTQLLEVSELTKTTFYRALRALEDAGYVVNEGSRDRPFYRTTQSPQSQPTPDSGTAPDLHVSHESHDVPLFDGEVPPVPCPLGMGLGPGTWDLGATR